MSNDKRYLELLLALYRNPDLMPEVLCDLDALARGEIAVKHEQYFGSRLGGPGFITRAYVQSIEQSVLAQRAPKRTRVERNSATPKACAAWDKIYSDSNEIPTDRAIAKCIGCDPSTLSKSDKYQEHVRRRIQTIVDA